MKFTPSPSVSSSTTTANSFSENFCRSKGNTFGCFLGVLSRILCSKGLANQPSHPIESDKQEHFLKIDKVVDGFTTPNVVAKLMGLDSLPEIDFKTPQNPSDSFLRSKSINAGDLWEETEEMQGQQRRAKTAFSFRETQNYFELEDDDFFVLSFEYKSGRSKKKRSNFGNSEVGLTAKGHKHRENRKQRRKREEQRKDKVFSDEDRLSLKYPARNSPRCDNVADIQSQSYHICSLKDRPSCRKEETRGSKARRKKKKKKESCLGESKEDAAECGSENSSPVSVLDHREFVTDSDATVSEEDRKVRGPISGRDLSGGEKPSDESNGSLVEQERNREGNENRNVGLKRWNYEKPDKIQMLSRVCRLARAEIHNSNWKYRGMPRNQELEDAGTEFGQQIFDELVTELVDQLVGF